MTEKRRYQNPETGESFLAEKLSDVPEHIRLTSKVLRQKKKNRARAKAKRNRRGR